MKEIPNFSQEEKDFLIQNGYLIVDTFKYAPIETEEALKSLQYHIDNKLFDRLTITPSVINKTQLDELKVLFPSVCKDETRYDVLIGNQDELELLHQYIIENYSNKRIPQIWLQTSSELNLNLFFNLRLKISDELYQYRRDDKRRQNGILTMFKNGGFIEEHQDAGENSQRLCVLTFYLNNSYDMNNGGDLVITTKMGENIIIPPKIGTCVILDFTGNDGVLRNNLKHGVTPIKNNFSRYTYLSGIAL